MGCAPSLAGSRGFRCRAVSCGRCSILDGFSQVLDACRRGEGFALARAILVADDIAAGTFVVAVDEWLGAERSICVVHALVPAPGFAAERFSAWLRVLARPD